MHDTGPDRAQRRRRRQAAFVGRRPAHLEAARRGHRRRLLPVRGHDGERQDDAAASSSRSPRDDLRHRRRDRGAGRRPTQPGSQRRHVLRSQRRRPRLHRRVRRGAPHRHPDPRERPGKPSTEAPANRPPTTPPTRSTSPASKPQRQPTHAASPSSARRPSRRRPRDSRPDPNKQDLTRRRNAQPETPDPELDGDINRHSRPAVERRPSRLRAPQRSGPSWNFRTSRVRRTRDSSPWRTFFAEQSCSRERGTHTGSTCDVEEAGRSGTRGSERTPRLEPTYHRLPPPVRDPCASTHDPRRGGRT